MTTGFTNWTELGFFPLQDHEDDVPLGMRQQLAAGRILSLRDPSETGSAAESTLIAAEENGMGTIGDIHPWLFWQTRDREERATGAWSQSFAALVVEGKPAPTTGTSTGGVPAGLLPIRTGDYRADGRLKTKYPGWPSGFQSIPRGTIMLVKAGMEEAGQHELMLHADPRLISVNTEGPGTAGTLVCDLQSENEICMRGGKDAGTTPGRSGRTARLQSLARVVKWGPGTPFDMNGLAVNFDVASVDGLAGFGMIWTGVERGPTTGGGGGGAGGGGGGGSGGGPITGGGPGAGAGWKGPGDVTPGNDDSPPSSIDGVNAVEGRAGSAGGVESGSGGPEGRHDADLQRPNEFGQFRPHPKQGKGVAFLSATMGGPIHGGHENDRHSIGRDGDGNPVNPAHISTGALYYRSRKEDGPLAFEGEYPDPPGMPLRSLVHLSWDKKSETWRWWCEVPECVPCCDTPGGGGGDVPPPTTPRGPGPSTPGPSGPSTPGGGGGPPTGGPPGPSGPSSPGPSGPGFRKGPRGPGGPSTPGPTGSYPRGAGYGWRGPNTPPPSGPGIPQGPSTGGGGGPSTSGPSGPPTFDDGRTPDPDNPNGARGPITGGGGDHPGWSPPSPVPIGPAFGPKNVPGQHFPGPVDPDLKHDREKLTEAQIRENRQFVTLAKNVGTVGHTSAEDRSLFAISYPLMMAYTGMAFRPQLWIEGAQSFLHDNNLDADAVYADEQNRPQVLAMHAFGATSVAEGAFDYVKNPNASRARGGTGHGGIMFTPPQYEPEDYFGISTVADVTTSETDSVVMVTPGVAFALGTPAVSGALNAKTVTLGQDVAGDPTSHSLTIAQRNASGVAVDLLQARVSQTDGEVRVTAGGTAGFVVPAGTTAQRPTTPVAGETRVNTSGAADVVEFWEAQAGAWVEVDVVGPAISPTFLASIDTPGSYASQTLKLLRVNAGETAVEFVDGDTIYTPDADVFKKDGSVAMTGVPDFGANKLSNLGAGGLGNDAFTITQALATFVNVTGGTMTGWLTVQADNIGVAFGASGVDSVMYWDGTNFNINTGLGELKILNGDLRLGDGQSLVLGTGLDASIKYTGSNLEIKSNVAGSGLIKLQSDTSLNDNQKLRFGNSGDARVYYDGTDMIIQPDAVGTGKMSVNGDVNVVLAHDYYHNSAQGHTESIEITGIGTLEVSGGIITDWTPSGDG